MAMYHLVEAMRRTRRLMLDLESFHREHRGCGRPLDGGVEDDRIWIACSCGARISRNVSASWKASAPRGGVHRDTRSRKRPPLDDVLARVAAETE
jgi:hypothetical protein